MARDRVSYGRRPGAGCTALTIDRTDLADPIEATTAALGARTARINALTAEISIADRRLTAIVAAVAPRTSNVFSAARSRRTAAHHRRR